MFYNKDDLSFFVTAAMTADFLTREGKIEGFCGDEDLTAFISEQYDKFRELSRTSEPIWGEMIEDALLKDFGPQPEREFIVTMHIHGAKDYTVTARTPEEAKEKATTYYEADDLGGLDTFDSDITYIEDEFGNSYDC